MTGLQYWAMAAGAFGCGFFLGGYRKVAPFKALIKSRNRALTLGRLMTGEKERSAAAEAYLDRDAAAGELGGYAWDIPLHPAPFLGSVPAPVKKDDLRINSQHFRASEEVVMPKPEKRFRIFITGGSTALGAGAPDQERTIGGYLERLLESRFSAGRDLVFEVFTAACTAWASTHERIVTENLISEQQPDMVISFSGNNDVHWGWNKKNIMWFRTYAENHFRKIITAAHEAAGHAPPEDCLADLSEVPSPDTVARLLLKNVYLMTRVLADAGAVHVFVLQPTMAVTKKKLSGREEKWFENWHPVQAAYFIRCYEMMGKVLSEGEIPGSEYYFFDLSGLFDGCSEKDEIFLDAYHFGDRGYDLIASEIFERIAPMVEERLEQENLL